MKLTSKHTPTNGQESTKTDGPVKGGRASAPVEVTDDRVTPANARPATVPAPAAGELLNATDAAKLLGIGRTRFWQLRKEFGLERVDWTPELRPLYRRDDVLRLTGVPQGAEPAAPDSPLPVKGEHWTVRIHKFAHLEELPDGWDDGCSDD